MPGARGSGVGLTEAVLGWGDSLLKTHGSSDLAISATRLSSLASPNAGTTVPYRAVHITLLDASC